LVFDAVIIKSPFIIKPLITKKLLSSYSLS